MTQDTDVIDIGEVVRRSGLPASTLHVWEKNGLIMPVGREGLRRQYRTDVIDRIAAIALFQRGGFTLAEIRAVMEPGALDSGKDLIAAKLVALEEQRDRLDAAIDGLRHAVACEEPSPVECDGFRSMAAEILPVRR